MGYSKPAAFERLLPARVFLYPHDQPLPNRDHVDEAGIHSHPAQQ
jgi:hypothetical protein